MATGYEKYPHLYGSTRWRKASRRHLQRHPLCAQCEKMGRVVVATIVHHKAPHNGNEAIFWDESGWESVCATCHSGIKRMEETRGYSAACGVDGVPMDANHPWNRK